MNFFLLSHETLQNIYDCVRVNQRRFIRKLQFVIVLMKFFPCPADQILDGKKLVKLRWHLASSYYEFFMYVCVAAPQIFAAMLTGIKSWSKEFFLAEQKTECTSHCTNWKCTCRAMSRKNVLLMQLKIPRIEITTTKHAERTERIKSKKCVKNIFTKCTLAQVSSIQFWVARQR